MIKDLKTKALKKLVLENCSLIDEDCFGKINLENIEQGLKELKKRGYRLYNKKFIKIVKE